MDCGNNKSTHSGNQTVTIYLYHVVITGTSSGLSILGAIIIFVTYFTIKEIQNFTRLLLLYLTMADVLVAVSNLLAVGRFVMEYPEINSYRKTVYCPADSTKHYNILSVCVIQSFLTTYSSLVSFFWTVTLAFHMWSSVVLKTWRTEMLQMQVVYHVICWIAPFAVVFALLIDSHLGEDYCYGTGVWCGIRSSPTHAWTRYIGDIAWQIGCYLIAAMLYIHLKFYLKLYYDGQRLAMVAGRLRNEDENFLVIWIVIYLLKLWGIIRFFVMMYTSKDKLSHKHMQSFLDFLLIMQSYGASGQAFWNCIFFCLLDKTVRQKIKRCLGCGNTGETSRLLLTQSVT